MEYDVELFDLLVLDDEGDDPDDGSGLTCTFKVIEVDDVIQLTDSIDSHHYDGSFSDRISINDTVALTTGCTFNATMTDTLTFTDVLDSKPHQDFGDLLQLFDSMEIAVGYTEDFLDLEDTITGVSGPSMLDTITFTDSISQHVSINLVSQDTVTFIDGMSAFINNRWVFIVPIVEERP